MCLVAICVLRMQMTGTECLCGLAVALTSPCVSTPSIAASTIFLRITEQLTRPLPVSWRAMSQRCACILLLPCACLLHVHWRGRGLDAWVPVRSCSVLSVDLCHWMTSCFAPDFLRLLWHKKQALVTCLQRLNPPQEVGEKRSGPKCENELVFETRGCQAVSDTGTHSCARTHACTGAQAGETPSRTRWNAVPERHLPTHNICLPLLTRAKRAMLSWSSSFARRTSKKSSNSSSSKCQ